MYNVPLEIKSIGSVDDKLYCVMKVAYVKRAGAISDCSAYDLLSKLNKLIDMR